MKKQQIKNDMLYRKQMAKNQINLVMPLITLNLNGPNTPTKDRDFKLCWSQWLTPGIPATREAEVGESLEPERQRPQ